jgi:hypothetical protein
MSQRQDVEFQADVDIHRLRAGLSVIAAFPRNGYDPDKARFERYLKFGQTYTVDRFEIEGWVTNVWLKEIPDVMFNSVQFAEAES